MRESILRTLVPIIYALLLKAGLDGLGVDDAVIQSAAALLATGLLYVGVRLAEKARPGLGWLLGYPSAPSYAVPDSEGVYDISTATHAERQTFLDEFDAINKRLDDQED